MALWLTSCILITLNPLLIFFGQRCVSKTLTTQLACVLLSNSQRLLQTIELFLPFLKVILKGLKQFTSNGYKAWDVWDDNAIMSKPNCCASCMITCDPCPTRINRCWLDLNMLPKVDLLKNDKKSLWIERRSSMPSFAFPYMFFFYKCIFNRFTLEYV
jgi:hypothetical protein